ncbi:sensor histidine kinase [Plantactinospora sonchi]|uniref:histidine kinase n=1 Tax=Plantactinospora sonchi TaxID=1544735 RepID=A0ABU7S593_9ACTN
MLARLGSTARRRRVLELVRERRDLLLDTFLWAVLCAPIGWALLSPPYGSWTAVRLGGGLLVMAVAVLAGRRAPLFSLVIVIVSTLVDGNFVFAIPVMSYLVGRRMSRAGPAAFTFGAIALGGTLLNLGPLRSDAEMWYFLATTLVFGGVLPWLLGRYRRQHQALVLAGWEQAELLEREQRGVAERIRMRERARIAQDIHDSLGHDLSLIALRAGALELAADLDERHRRAAGEVRTSVTLATERLRQVIGVLREDAEPAPTRPVGEGIAELVERSRAAGMSVRLLIGPDAVGAGRDLSERAGPHAVGAGRDLSEQVAWQPVGAGRNLSERAEPQVVAAGRRLSERAAPQPVTPERECPGSPLDPGQEALPPSDRESGNGTVAGPSTGVEVRLPAGVPPLVDRTVYRVVQEALTNANRHAPGAAVTVRLGTAPDRTLLRVVNDLPPAGPLPVTPGSGTGLLGLREWVRLAGGTLRAGPAAGGFEVTVDLPHVPGTAADGVGELSGWERDPGVASASPSLTGATQGLRRARRQVRRSLLAVVAVPAVIAAGLTLAYYPIATMGAVLDSAEFDRMRLGQPRAELRDELPRRQITPPAQPAGEHVPAGAVCEHYTDGSFPTGRIVYRLCFLDGRLVTKDRVPG